MSYMDKFNVFMQEYGGDSGGGGGSPSLPDLGISNPFSGFTFTPSNYLFTDPPRYYKANDPYYYEVDNIPLKQIHENCLWLRDQMIGLELNVTGVPLSKILDLQPTVSNSDRIVRVNPGKFTGRVNDAYGLSPLFSQIFQTDSIDVTRPTIYTPPSITVEDSAFSTIVGETVANLFYSNGLYDQFQTHNAEIKGDYSGELGGVITIDYAPEFLDSGPLTIGQLPKIKAAVWQQLSPNNASLQQKAVDFTRRWQGVFRTAVVNVAEPLSIEIPPFAATDFLDNETTTYDPQVRIDLVFVYTHPIDSAQTHLLNQQNVGSAPETIVRPRLGVIKGAGQILYAAEGALDITGGEGIGSPSWQSQTNQPSRYYSTSATLEAGQALAIQAPLSDQVALNITNSPFPGKTTGLSFPSPDDLLNAAPILAQDGLESELITLGQSVLPLCYVIVKKDSSILLETDIIDIRPFLRTAELAYNERAGVGAANPPLSIVNPAAGKVELYQGLETTRDYILDLQDQLEERLNQLFAESINISQATTAIQFQQTITTNSYAPLEIKDAKYTYNAPVTGMSAEFDTVNSGKVFAENILNTNSIKVVPGRYHIQGTITAYAGATGNLGGANWEAAIFNGGLAVYPPSTFSLVFKTYYDHGEHNNEESGAVSINTIIEINPTGGNPNDGGDGVSYGELGIRVREIGNSSNAAICRGGFTITRISNFDGTAGPMPGAV